MKIICPIFKRGFIEMEMFRKFTLIFINIMMIGCYSHPAKAESVDKSLYLAKEANFILKNSSKPTCTMKIENNKNILHYIGGTDYNILDCLDNNIDKSIHKLVITSNGGNVETAIYAAIIIRYYKIRVDVLGVCISSCANYIASSTPYLTLRDFSILGLHGGPVPLTDDQLEKLLPRGPSTIRLSNDEENKLDEKTKIKMEKEMILHSLRTPVSLHSLFKKIAHVKDGLFDMDQLYNNNLDDGSEYLFSIPQYDFYRSCISTTNYVEPYKYSEEDKRKIESIMPFKGKIFFQDSINNQKCQ